MQEIIDRYELVFDGHVDDDVSYSEIPIVIGSRYFFKREKFAPYALANLGIHSLSSSGDVKISYSYEEPYRDGYEYKYRTVYKTKKIKSSNMSRTEFGIAFGAGFLYNIGNLKLDINAKFNFISDYNHFDFMLGLLFPIQ